MQAPVDLEALEAAARERLPAAIHAYVASGAGRGATLAANRAAFARRQLRPRVLVDVGRRDLGVTVLGERLAMPIAVAPMAFQRLVHADGERATARAAGRLGTAMAVATLATTAIEELAAAASGPLWSQIYVLRDRGATRALVERAVAAGARALLLTVDAALAGGGRHGAVSGFALPPGTRLPHLEGLPGVTPDVGDGPVSATFARLVDPSVTWDDLGWLRSLSRLPLVLKGILGAEDTRRAAAHGADAIVVSNHGGRVLDGVVATLDALPEVAEAAGDALEVWMDGGVRSGACVLKALALGARCVLVGRPVLWGLATGGEAGVAAVLATLRDELDTALALCGCRTPAELTRRHVT